MEEEKNPSILLSNFLLDLCKIQRMETLIIQYNQSIKEKLMKLLATFSKSELEIIETNQNFEKLKADAQEDYAYMVREDAEFFNIDEAKEELRRLRSL